ncbi:MAG: adenylate/guanylate cyclase domain-containing protein [Betaproteobacteria bacterium]
MQGREAYERYQWAECFRLLAAADEATPLAAADLERLAWSARWSGRYDEVLIALERAEREYERTGDRRGTARAALYLAYGHGDRGNDAVAGGCYARAQRLLENEPECAEHGLSAWMAAAGALRRGENTLAQTKAERALAIGERLADNDLRALGMLWLGHVRLTEGAIEQGMTLHDEACALVAAGRLAPITAGIVYCSVIYACRNRADWQRAHEWTEVADGWCARESIGYFPGLCRVHHAEVLRFRGAFDEAERDAGKALEQLAAALPRRVHWAHTELGEIRLRRGDLQGAAEACARAMETGPEPQPLLAMLQLARGDALAAVRSLERALATTHIAYSENHVNLLPVLVTSALGAALQDTAQAAFARLESLARRLATPAPLAAAAFARGELSMSEGRTRDAAIALAEARRLWSEIGAPYDAARAQVLLALALEKEGDRFAAEFEMRAACTSFERLGALRDKQQAAANLERLAGTDARSAAEAARGTFLFTDVVDSTKLVELLGDEAWTSLRRWHDRMLRACFEANGGTEVDHAGDGFFVAFAMPAAALRCAIDIQRKLDAHRTEHGFAPRVRIGVHAAAVLRSRGEFTGKGVHEAARIAAAGSAGEIIASRATVASAGDAFPASGVRTLELKGLSTPIEVTSVEWKLSI